MDFVLPATTYQPPSRLGRNRRLNTIMESDEPYGDGFTSDSDAYSSDRTIIGRPAELDMDRIAAQAKLRPRTSSLPYDQQHSSTYSTPMSSAGSGFVPNSQRESQRSSLRHSYAESDEGTVFSEDDCPSLTGSHASDPTTFYTHSTSNSVASGRSSRKQFPSILIPRESWQHMDSPVKEISLPMSPANKILLSPDALSRLPQHVPALNAPPSLGDTSSMASQSPNIPAPSSAPPTPNLHNLEMSGAQGWGDNRTNTLDDQEIELTGREEHNIMLSTAEPQRDHIHESEGYTTDWTDMVVHFPAVPGATPVSATPVSPNVDQFRRFRNIPSDHGVQLPSGAMSVLNHLTRSYSPTNGSEHSVASGHLQEMRERGSTPPSRPRSAEMATPASALSAYSFSELSIPSPGGFFNSLQASSRHTWCMPKSAATPSSAAAENFYSLPWPSSQQVTRQVVEAPPREVIADGQLTARKDEDPITARKIIFETSDRLGEVEQGVVEDDDMYGGSSDATTEQPSKTPSELRYEYEEAYEKEIKNAAEANLDRTSHWLAAQTAYLSALRETNPLNDPADHPVTPHPLNEDRNEVVNSETEKAERFLTRASKTLSIKQLGSPDSDGSDREELFLAAFTHHQSQRGDQDALLQASSRLDSINTNRLALPSLHILSLLNVHTSESLVPHQRPRYRGPFSQNPRATGVFSRTAEQAQYADAERKQLAMDRVLLNMWTIEAQQKLLFNGRLLACSEAAQRLTRKATIPFDSAENQGKERFRILDLAGAATASWAWAAAQHWPNVKIYTVQTQTQANLALKTPFNDEPKESTEKEPQPNPMKPANPRNHRVVTVPQLWQLPFNSNYFDVISTRTLHMLLRSKPVPGVESIDEWDLTLKECMRVLKPGGVLDFFLLDSSIATNRPTSMHQRNKSTDSQLSVNTNVDSVHSSGHTTANISPSNAVGQVASNSTTALPLTQTSRSESVTVEFGFELKRRGYDRDGGCSRLMSRLKKEGFVGVKRQWVGLPMGRAGPTHADPGPVEEGIAKVENNYGVDYLRGPSTRESSVLSRQSNNTQTGKPRAGSDASTTPAHFSTVFNADGSRKHTAFPLAPRPLSEVSSISRIIDQYSNVEAVQGPVGSTAEVADVAGLLGGIMWEEWLVRMRIEMGRKDPNRLLDGVNEVLSEGWMKGASWRGIVGWAKKPRGSRQSTDTSARHSRKVSQPTKAKQQRNNAPAGTLSQLPAGSVTSSSSSSKKDRRLAFDQLNLSLDTVNIDRALKTAPLQKTFFDNNQQAAEKQAEQRAQTAAPTYVRPSKQQYNPPTGRSSGSNDSLLGRTPGALERGEIGTIPMMILQ